MKPLEIYAETILTRELVPRDAITILGQERFPIYSNGKQADFDLVYKIREMQ